MINERPQFSKTFVALYVIQMIYSWHGRMLHGCYHDIAPQLSMFDHTT